MNSRHTAFAPGRQSAWKTAPMMPCAVAILCLFVWNGAQAEPLPPNSYIYGIDDDNFLWQLDPVSKTSVRVYQTVLTGISNALAFDTGRNDLFAVDGSNDLWWWNAVVDSPAKVATAADLGLTANRIDQPWSAAYYDNSYWFFRGASTQGTNELSRVMFNYSGETPIVQSMTTFTISGTSLTENSFGDIAITPSGTLYAYNQATVGRFYSLDLNTAASGTVGGFNLINTTSGTGLQLSFNADYTTLYGHNYDDGKWYEINTSNGSLTEVAGFTSIATGSFGFRDLGGATITAVPEPSTLMLAGVGVGSALWTITCRRRRRRCWQPTTQDQPLDMAIA